MIADEFRALLLGGEAIQKIVADHLISDGPGAHVSQPALDFIADMTRQRFQIPVDAALRVIVVGSAKLGFSIIEKTVPMNTVKPRYRDYVPGVSDIDIAMVSAALYAKLWAGLALFGANKQKFPWRSKLSDYMFHGWIRPDKFPFENPPQVCKDWTRLRDELNRSAHFSHAPLRCAIFQSPYFLSLYQQRSVRDAMLAEEAI